MYWTRRRIRSAPRPRRGRTRSAHRRRSDRRSPPPLSSFSPAFRVTHRVERLPVLAHGLPTSASSGLVVVPSIHRPRRIEMRRLDAFTPFMTLTLVALVAVVLFDDTATT